MINESLMNTKPIKLTLERPYDKVSRCGSRFWGNPDLPVGYGYPSFEDEDGEPFEYQFVCQINLADIAEFDPEGLLPHKGLLSFFAKIDRYLGHFDNGTSLGLALGGPDDVKVLYFPDVVEAADDVNAGFAELVLVDDDEQPLNPREWGIRFNVPDSADYADDHALLAEPVHREWEDWDEPCSGWRILLQVDSCFAEDYELNFIDCGVLDFLISPEDLAAARFDRVRGQILST